MRRCFHGKISGGLLGSILAVCAFFVGFGAFVFFDKGVFQSGPVPEEYVYDIHSLALIEPDQIIYHEAAGPIATGLKTAAGLDVDKQKRIYVVGEGRLVILDPAADGPREVELSGEATCIKVGEDRIYAGLHDHIEVLTPEGAVLQVWDAPAAGAWLSSVAARGEDVFAADAQNKVVWHFDMRGNVIKAIGRKDSERNIPGFLVPNPHFEVAVVPDGLLRVVDPGRHRVEAYTFDGDLEWYWGSPGVGLEGFSGCCNPIALAILPDGGFITGEKGLVRVKEYDAEGRYAGVVAGPDQLGWSEPLKVCTSPEECRANSVDVAVDGDGVVYVLDCVKGVVHRYEKK